MNDIELPEVVKKLMNYFYKVITYDFVDAKSNMTGRRIDRPSFEQADYYFISPVKNMGILFWLLTIYLVGFTVKTAFCQFTSNSY